MNRFQEFLYKLHPFLLSSVASILTAGQIIHAFLLRTHTSGILNLTGWICLWLAGIFGILPIITFRRTGGVPKGMSYMKTTRLVDTGIYAIMRHPQSGTAWLLINLGIILITMHWVSLILGSVSMTLAYIDLFKSDQYCLEKFGEEYKQYMQRVPRVNFIAGIIRLFSEGNNRPDE